MKPLIMLAILALVVGCVQTSVVTFEDPIPIETSIDRTYTYEGQLDPADFNNWSGASYQTGPYGMVYILQNPRKYAAIKICVCLHSN